MNKVIYKVGVRNCIEDKAMQLHLSLYIHIKV